MDTKCKSKFMDYFFIIFFKIVQTYKKTEVRTAMMIRGNDGFSHSNTEKRTRSNSRHVSSFRLRFFTSFSCRKKILANLSESLLVDGLFLLLFQRQMYITEGQSMCKEVISNPFPSFYTIAFSLFGLCFFLNSNLFPVCLVKFVKFR